MDLSGDAIRRALRTRWLGHRVVYVERIPSTMDLARSLAREGCPEGTLVVAEEQTAGRGRFGRAWVSPPGVNLYFTLVFYPSVHAFPRLGMAAALAVRRGVEEVTGLRPSIKWPNDLLLGGKKFCGVLAEGVQEGERIRYALLGVGIDVNMEVEAYAELAGLATSLRAQLGRPVSRLDLLAAVLAALEDRYERLRRGESLHPEWAAALETLGRWVRVRWGEEVHEGLAVGTTEEGALILQRADGSTLTVTAGEVTTRP